MQTTPLLLASGIHTVWTSPHNTPRENTMSKTLSLALAPSSTLFSRFLAIVDKVLMTNARIAERNGDLPYFGL